MRPRTFILKYLQLLMFFIGIYLIDRGMEITGNTITKNLNFIIPGISIASLGLVWFLINIKGEVIGG